MTENMVAIHAHLGFVSRRHAVDLFGRVRVGQLPIDQSPEAIGRGYATGLGVDCYLIGQEKEIGVLTIDDDGRIAAGSDHAHRRAAAP